MAYKKAFAPDKNDMLAICVKYNGNLSAISLHFNISRETMYQYFKRDPEGKKILENVRGYNTEIELDTAEQVIHYNMNNYKSSPGLAQRAAEKVIDKKGHLRGWGVEDVSRDAPKQSDIDQSHENMRLKYQIAQLEKKLEKFTSSIPAKKESLHGN